LQERAVLDAFEDALHNAPPWPTPGKTVPLTPRPTQGDNRFMIRRSTSLHEAMQALAIQELMTRLEGASLWWRPATLAAEPTLSLVQGLPHAERFADLLLD